MSWENILKLARPRRRVGLHMPAARECVRAWVAEQEIGTVVTMQNIIDGAKECYYGRLPDFINEVYADKTGVRPSIIAKYERFWDGQSGVVLGNILTFNPEPENSWVTVTGQKVTYMKVG